MQTWRYISVVNTHIYTKNVALLLLHVVMVGGCC